jgi:hypothetical protein
VTHGYVEVTHGYVEGESHMGDPDEKMGLAFLLVLLAVGAAVAAHYGMFYVTGSQFYEACWELKAKAKAIGGFKDPEASNPSQAILWANCTPIAARGLDEAGFLFGSSAQNAPGRSKSVGRLLS